MFTFVKSKKIFITAFWCLLRTRGRKHIRAHPTYSCAFTGFPIHILALIRSSSRSELLYQWIYKFRRIWIGEKQFFANFNILIPEVFGAQLNYFGNKMDGHIIFLMKWMVRGIIQNSAFVGGFYIEICFDYSISPQQFHFKRIHSTAWIGSKNKAFLFDFTCFILVKMRCYALSNIVDRGLWS